MNKEYRCIDGTYWTDPREAVEDWLFRVYGETVELRRLTWAGENLIATVYRPKESVPIQFVQIPADVTFRFNQIQGEFVKIFYADREKSGNRVFVRLSDSDSQFASEIRPHGINPIVLPDFEWGYCGERSELLAYAILQNVFEEELSQDGIAVKHFEDFAARFIANLPVQKWEVTDQEVRRWIQNAEKGVLL